MKGMDFAMNEYVAVKNLIKNYGDLCAVDNLSFAVKEGEIFGLLGPNGAGKSTTMNIITTLDVFNKGSIHVSGMDITKHRSEIKRLIGFVPQDIALYPELTAVENVEFFASLYGLKGNELKKSAMRALEFVGLTERAKMKPKKMSGGMQRRLNIACGIAHKPKLIIMDEPTVGVDAQSREHILESIKTLKSKGATVIYTSHYMNEVEAICDRIAIIDRGQLIALGTTEELVSLVTDNKAFSVKTRFQPDFNEKEFIKETLKLPGVINVRIDDDMVKIDTKLSCQDFSIMLEQFNKYNLPILSVNSETPDLDTVFLTLTGHEMR